MFKYRQFFYKTIAIDEGFHPELCEAFGGIGLHSSRKHSPPDSGLELHTATVFRPIDTRQNGISSLPARDIKKRNLITGRFENTRLPFDCIDCKTPKKKEPTGPPSNSLKKRARTDT